MSVLVPRGPTLDGDAGLRAVAGVLEQYVADHPGAEAELYRRGEYLIRVRVVDGRFAGLTRGQRHRAVWHYLLRLPDEVLSDVTYVLAVTPDERGASPASHEFDDPTPLYQPGVHFQVGPWLYPLQGDAVVASVNAYDQQVNPPRPPTP